MDGQFIIWTLCQVVSEYGQGQKGIIICHDWPAVVISYGVLT